MPSANHRRASNPNFPVSNLQLKDAQEAAAQIGVRLLVLDASTESEIEPAFAKLVAGARMH